MKNITEYIKESIDINSNLYKLLAPDGHIRSDRYIWRDNLSKELKWSLIGDDDFEKLDPEDAYKMEYKRNSTDYIVWMKDNKICFRSIGLLVNFSSNKRSTIKNSYKSTDYAILIKDYTRFDTNVIKSIKRKQDDAIKEFKELSSIFDTNYHKWFSIVDKDSEYINKIHLQLDIFTKGSDAIQKTADYFNHINNCESCKSNLYNNIGDIKGMVNTIEDIVNWVKTCLDSNITIDRTSFENFLRSLKRDL